MLSAKPGMTDPLHHQGKCYGEIESEAVPCQSALAASASKHMHFITHTLLTKAT
jgi:hypothetical protein